MRKAVLGIIVGLVVGIAAVTGCGAPERPTPGELAARAGHLGVGEDLVYVLVADGPATGPGPAIGGGYQAAYPVGTVTARLTVQHRTLTAPQCPMLPIPGATGLVRCARAGAGFYRVSPDAHEYALNRDGYLVRVSAPRNVRRERLRSLAYSAHHASAEDLDALLPGLDAPVQAPPPPPPGGDPAADDLGG